MVVPPKPEAIGPPADAGPSNPNPGASPALADGSVFEGATIATVIALSSVPPPLVFESDATVMPGVRKPPDVVSGEAIAKPPPLAAPPSSDARAIGPDAPPVLDP